MIMASSTSSTNTTRSLIAPGVVLLLTVIFMAVTPSATARSDSGEEYYYNNLLREAPENYEEKSVRNLDGIDRRVLDPIGGGNLQIEPKPNDQLNPDANLDMNTRPLSYPNIMLIRTRSYEDPVNNWGKSYPFAKRHLDEIGGGNLLKRSYLGQGWGFNTLHSGNMLSKRQVDQIGGGNLPLEPNDDPAPKNQLHPDGGEDMNARSLPYPSTMFIKRQNYEDPMINWRDMDHLDGIGGGNLLIEPNDDKKSNNLLNPDAKLDVNTRALLYPNVMMIRRPNYDDPINYWKKTYPFGTRQLDEVWVPPPPRDDGQKNPPKERSLGPIWSVNTLHSGNMLSERQVDQIGGGNLPLEPNDGPSPKNQLNLDGEEDMNARSLPYPGIMFIKSRNYEAPEINWRGMDHLDGIGGGNLLIEPNVDKKSNNLLNPIGGINMNTRTLSSPNVMLIRRPNYDHPIIRWKKTYPFGTRQLDEVWVPPPPSDDRQKYPPKERLLGPIWSFNILKSGNMLGKRQLDQIGGGNLLKRSYLGPYWIFKPLHSGNMFAKRHLDQIGGGNLLKRSNMKLVRLVRPVPYSLSSRHIDELGGGHLLGNSSYPKKDEEKKEEEKQNQ